MIEVGQKYRHFKGGLYDVTRVDADCSLSLDDGQPCYYCPDSPGFLFLACSEIEPTDTVVFYRAQRSGRFYARSLQNFTEVVDGVPRFQLLD